MALLNVHWSSKVLQKKVATYVIVPEIGAPPFPVFYLLHGLSDDYTAWVRRTRIEWYVRELPLIVVMPDGYRGFYTDNDAGPAYATHFAEELPAFIERTFPAERTRRARCVGGLSMGGYGALRLALGYPDRYASANSHSGAVAYGGFDCSREGSPLSPTETRQIFGPTPRGSDHDLLALASRAKSRGAPLPELLIDCGTEDHLLADNRALHAGLERLGIPHSYREFPGAHDWDYWDAHVRDAIDFHARALDLKRESIT